MANCLFLKGIKCYSARSEIRYRSPVQINTPLRFEGFVENSRKSFVFLRGLGFTIKDDKSPLTKADLESNKIIIDSLKKINNRIPILSEESCVDWSTRKNWETYWLVDPLDGTKEFINKNGEFTVNIALIHNNRPILGVIYAPVFSTLYFAYKNGGSYKLEINREDSKKFFFDHSLKLSVSTESKKHLT